MLAGREQHRAVAQFDANNLAIALNERLAGAFGDDLSIVVAQDMESAANLVDAAHPI